MSYRYRNSPRRSSSRWMALRYAGVCKVCGTSLPVDARAFWDASARTVTCDALDCAEADGLTTTEPLTGPWDKRTDTRVLTESRVRPAAPAQFTAARFGSRKVYTARLNSGAVVSVNANGRCEDAPCCGCCT